MDSKIGHDIKFQNLKNTKIKVCNIFCTQECDFSINGCVGFQSTRHQLFQQKKSFLQTILFSTFVSKCAMFGKIFTLFTNIFGKIFTSSNF